MFIRTAWLGLMIHALSEVAHQTFDVLFSQPPYQSNKTISDKSADPNGTLLTGLRCTKAPLAQVIETPCLSIEIGSQFSGYGFSGTYIHSENATRQTWGDISRRRPESEHVATNTQRMSSSSE